MKVSARFKQGILASAIMAAMAIPSPMCFGQSFAGSTNQQTFKTNSPQHWLSQSRQMMEAGRFEVAQQYIDLADTILQQHPVADLEFTPDMARRQLALMKNDGGAPVATPTVAANSTSVAASEAKTLLLRARQALAIGDVDQAQTLIESAEATGVDFNTIGDSPSALRTMLDRQNELSEMRAQSDARFNPEAAAFLLTQAEGLVKHNDAQTARMLIEQSKQFQVSFTPEMGDPDQLLQQIEAMESGSSKSMVLEQTKKQSLALLSQAQLAMDQQRWDDATALVQQAQSLGLSDDQYDEDQTRPWQLELKIQESRQASAMVAMDSGSDFNPSMAGSGDVSTADFRSDADTTRNVAVAAVADASGKFGDMVKPQPAMEIYQAGVRAFNEQDTARANQFFSLAMQRESELTPAAKMTIESLRQQSVKRDDNVQPAQAQSDVASAMDLAKIRNEQQAEFRKLQSAIYKERAAAEKLLESSPSRALQSLTSVRNRIESANLAPETRRPLLTLIDRDITEIQAYIEQNLPEIENAESNAAAKDLVERRAQRRIDTDEQIARLVEDYNNLIDESRFAEAGQVVQQAMELAPDSEVVAVMDEKYRAERNAMVAREITSRKEQGNLLGLQSVDTASIMMDDREPLMFGDADTWSDKSRSRLERVRNQRYSNESERDIWNRLRNTEVQGEYRGTLAEAIGQLSRQAGVNIIFDNLAMDAAGIRTDQLIDLPLLQPVKLENALNVLLGNARLVFTVENEVIKITTPESKRSDTRTETYYIGDLVMPMQVQRNPLDMMWNNNPYQDRGVGYNGGMMNVNGANPQTIPGGTATNTLAMAQQLGGGLPGNAFGGSPGGYGAGGPAYGNPAYGKVGGSQLGGITANDFIPLIDLIQSTIQSDSWSESGTGEGTIQSYPANLSLVVNNTQEVQDQIVDLLKKLRELNDVQIVIEVRFITLTDNFFERIGVDFDFSINDNLPDGTDVTADTLPQSAIVGRQGVDPFVPTGNLDLEFLQSSFGSAIPAVGGFDVASAANFGFAILSDIEVYFLIQASKGNSRLNVTNSPTVTMFNGQSASVTDGFQRPFVTSVQPVVGDFAVAHQPIITILPDGTNLNVSAVVSNDRRSVRMTLVPQFTQIGEVETFTFSGEQRIERSTNSFLDDLLDINNPDDSDDEIVQTNTGVTIQLPIIATTSVSTVVSVPDGGTILLGGIKRMTESREERGIPFLSNIPYVSRLFKNVGVGRTTANLMMMVTPRIIIQAEEEARQIGDTSN